MLQEIQESRRTLFEYARRAGFLRTDSVNYPNQKVSCNPMISERYRNCNGVVLLGDGVAGCSHYDMNDKSFYDYLDKLVLDTSRANDWNDLGAILIGGDVYHFSRNLGILRQLRIPVFGSYCDGWPEDTVTGTKAERKRKGYHEKSLVVIPCTKEVFLDLDGENILKLHPLLA